MLPNQSFITKQFSSPTFHHLKIFFVPGRGTRGSWQKQRNSADLECNRAPGFVLSRFPGANRYPSADQGPRAASLENAREPA
jgi:hypothetical protein